MTRNRFFAALALVAAGAFSTSIALAGDAAPKAAPVEAKPAAEAPKADTKPETKTEAPATKTQSPIHSLLGFVSKQVAPNCECGCPSKPEGEKAWRAWFAGGKDVPMAALRDQLVADGWTADRFVGFFKDMAAKQGCHGGDCDKGDCAKGDCDKSNGDCAKGDCDKSKGDGCCKGSGERADGKPCCGKCKDGAAKDAPAAPATNPAPEKAPEQPAKP